MALNGLVCAEVQLRNYSVTQLLCVDHKRAGEAELVDMSSKGEIGAVVYMLCWVLCLSKVRLANSMIASALGSPQKTLATRVR